MLTIDPEALIVPPEQARAHKIGGCATDAGPSGSQNACLGFLLDQHLRCGGVLRQFAARYQVGARSIDQRATAAVTLRQGNEGAAKPIPHRQQCAFIAHIGAEAVASASGLMDQIEDHERVTRPL